MLIIATISSILAITVLSRFVGRILQFNVCPICAGVFLTWVGQVALHFLGYQIDLTMPALLMGGSVVGIAYQIEKRRQNVGASGILLWKTLFIPAGFAAAYGMLAEQWTTFLSAFAFLLLVWFLFSYKNEPPGSLKETVEKIKREITNCC